MTVLEALNESVSYLNGKDIEDSTQVSKILLENRLGVNRASLISMYNNSLDKKIYKLFKKDIIKRGNHYPLDYIIGYKPYNGFNIKVNKNVLIPRDDTETVINESISEFKKYAKDIKNNDEDRNDKEVIYNIMDMCTGSGIIALSLARDIALSQVYGVDVSSKALKVAKVNKKINKINNVSFIKSNLFNKFKSNKFDNYFDMIVSNPPYIKTEICKGLDKEVKDHEPMLALDGGLDGLDFYKKIIKEAKRLLKDNGILSFEIDYTYFDILKNILEEENYYDIRVTKDMNNLDRSLVCRLHKY